MNHIITLVACAPFDVDLITGERATITHERVWGDWVFGYQVTVGGRVLNVGADQVVPIDEELDMPEPPLGWQIVSLRPPLVVVGDAIG